LAQTSNTVETKQAIQTLVALVGRLVVCGAVELRPKPGAGEQIHVMPGFRVPMPKTGANKSVRNIHAFDVLQSIFLSACSSELALIVLDTIRGIYLQDLSNYFILEQQNTLVAFAKKIFHKPVDVQDAFFNLLEVLVNKLHYVPMKEISSIVVLLKTCHLTPCVAVALRHLIRLVREHRTFKEVFHDVGLLELGVELLHRFADNLDEAENIERTKQEGRSSSGLPQPTHPIASEVGQLILDFLRYSVTGSVANADLCVRLGAAECLINRILSMRTAVTIRSELRRSALLILEELILTNGGEDLMPALLSKMHTTSVALKVENTVTSR
uniref:Non-specific serine/threonine protein kinase n=1 Tax=Echinostoma caproni TaxID=27848 RepID=A0A183AST9_9TREM